MTLLGNFSEVQLLELSQIGFSTIEKIHHLMSFHNRESELTRINLHAHTQPQSISALTFELLQHVLTLSELTHGLFDVSIGSALVKLQALPNHGFCVDAQANWQDIHLHNNGVFFSKPLQIDLGGIAKGFAVDKAVEAIQQAAKNINAPSHNAPSDINISINAGGDLRMTHWHNQTIGIRDPQQPQTLIPVTLKNTALATSACYFLTKSFLKKNMGIFSPKTQTPIHDKHSYSVFADSCMLADALTKVIALMENPDTLLAQLKAEKFIF
jgi:FAD:protein FMN transferase